MVKETVRLSHLVLTLSGRTDRLARLPLRSGHPEEDRAGQGVLTDRPPGASTSDPDAEKPEDRNGQRGGGAGGRVCLLSTALNL